MGTQSSNGSLGAGYSDDEFAGEEYDEARKKDL